MLFTLNVPYVDTSAAELVWTLDQPPMAALTTAEVPPAWAGARLELRVLGASHQVVLRWEGAEIVETVACLPDQRPHLPATAEQAVHGRRYRFRACVDDVAPGELQATVGWLRQLAGRDDGDGSHTTTVLGAFPSVPDAVTALRAQRPTGAAPGVSWDTWHVYPNSRQIVTTSTEVF